LKPCCNNAHACAPVAALKMHGKPFFVKMDLNIAKVCCAGK